MPSAPQAQIRPALRAVELPTALLDAPAACKTLCSRIAVIASTTLTAPDANICKSGLLTAAVSIIAQMLSVSAIIQAVNDDIRIAPPLT